jgi:hypothetical protein
LLSAALKFTLAISSSITSLYLLLIAQINGVIPSLSMTLMIS